jgi:hypothetical protein
VVRTQWKVLVPGEMGRLIAQDGRRPASPRSLSPSKKRCSASVSSTTSMSRLPRARSGRGPATARPGGAASPARPAR